MMKPRFRPSRCAQRGVSLFIALIILVAMMLTGVAVIRSVDAGNMLSGNLALKQSTLQAADQGVDAAYQWLLANAGNGTLDNTNQATGYYSSRPATEPDWTDPTQWPAAVALQPDAAGNTVSYVIHRMCTQPNTPYNGNNGGVANECAMSFASGGSSSGGSMSVDAPVFQGNPQLFFRVTSLTTGPRGTYSVTQSMVRVSN